MTEAEAAWLAGFFDGEGSLITYPSPRSKYGTAWALSIPNAHQGAVEKCRQMTGAGTVRRRLRVVPVHYKPQWLWEINSQRNIASIVRQMLPYLVVKRQAGEDFLTIWSDIQE